MLALLLAALDSFGLIRTAPVFQTLSHADTVNSLKAGSNVQEAKVLGDFENAKNIDQGIDGLRVADTLPTGETTPLLKTNMLSSDVPPIGNPYEILKPIDPPKSFLAKSKSYMKDLWNKFSFKTIGQKVAEQGKTANTKFKDAFKNKFSKPPEKSNPALVDEKLVNPQTIENPAGLSQPLEIVPVAAAKSNLLAKSNTISRSSWEGLLVKLYRKLKGPVGKVITKIREVFKKPPNKPEPIFKVETNLDDPMKLTKTETPKASLNNMAKNSILNSWNKLSSAVNRQKQGLKQTINKLKDGFTRVKEALNNKIRNAFPKRPAKILPDGPPIPVKPDFANSLDGPVSKMKHQPNTGLKQTTKQIKDRFNRIRQAFKTKFQKTFPKKPAKILPDGPPIPVRPDFANSLDSLGPTMKQQPNAGSKLITKQVKDGFDRAKEALKNKIQKTLPKRPAKTLPEGPPIPVKPEFANSLDSPIKQPEKAIANNADGLPIPVRPDFANSLESPLSTVKHSERPIVNNPDGLPIPMRPDFTS
ncbi:hypothetical protein BY996DRAFT_6593930 [Phakopsora pachyrhizi]|nr:hypothetical protein BY996DRAFT_6593930 [Phakopsora pachyrhizi]